jgi:hypothetical protein
MAGALVGWLLTDLAPTLADALPAAVVCSFGKIGFGFMGAGIKPDWRWPADFLNDEKLFKCSELMLSSDQRLPLRASFANDTSTKQLTAMMQTTCNELMP